MRGDLYKDILTRPFTLMGILNVTPDSFSDGGLYLSSSVIMEKCRQMVLEGAQIIDIGGESSRPGASPVSPEEEIERVIPVVQLVRGHFPDITISVDTCKSKVAYQALENGADIINDISALRFDPEMTDVLRHFGCPVVLMHMQGTPRNMQQNPHYDDVVAEVCDFLIERSCYAREKGICKEKIIIDPGIGFGKTLEHNLLLLRHLRTIKKTGYPVLLGTSRKSFIGTICSEKEPLQRKGGTVATTVWGYLQGIKMFRVHDVAANFQALQVVREIEKQGAFS